MPDICMCTGEGCRLRERCWRFTAKPCQLQSYFLHPPVRTAKDDTQVCDHFCDTGEGN